jgi:hypothetical protein
VASYKILVSDCQTARRQTKIITILAVTVRESGISEINNNVFQIKIVILIKKLIENSDIYLSTKYFDTENRELNFQMKKDFRDREILV